MKKQYVIGIFVGIILVILAAFFVWKYIKHPSQIDNQKSSVSHIAPLPKETIITLTNNGFSPNQITVKVGTSVRWKNVSGSQQSVNSDNYPTNQLHRQLNFGIFNSGTSVTYIFTIPGIYGYHNQLHHTQEGKVIVVK